MKPNKPHIKYWRVASGWLCSQSMPTKRGMQVIREIGSTPFEAYKFWVETVQELRQAGEIL